MGKERGQKKTEEPVSSWAHRNSEWGNRFHLNLTQVQSMSLLKTNAEDTWSLFTNFLPLPHGRDPQTSSGILGLSHNHQLTCGFPVTDFWNHRKPRFAISPWQVAVSHSRWGQTPSKQNSQPCYVHCQAALRLLFLTLSPASLPTAHVHTGAAWVLWSHSSLKIHFSVSQPVLSRSPHSCPGWGLMFELNATSLPPDAAAADWAALQTSTRLICFTNHSFLFHPLLYLLFKTARIH